MYFILGPSPVIVKRFTNVVPSSRPLNAHLGVLFAQKLPISGQGLNGIVYLCAMSLHGLTDTVEIDQVDKRVIGTGNHSHAGKDGLPIRFLKQAVIGNAQLTAGFE